MRIAVVGMGNMGQAFAVRALDQGHHVTVWNRTPGKAAPVIERGGVEADTPGAAATGAEVVLVVLSDDAAAIEVSEGPGGVLAGLAPGAVFANVSTVSPSTARRLAAEGPDGRVLDTPVAGSPSDIARGRGRFFVGGPAEALALVVPLLDDLGSGYVHCGPAGTGATMKLVSNLLLITGVSALAEALATARRHGITDELLRDIFAESMVVSPATSLRLGMVLDVNHPGWFSPALARKDVRLAVALADEAGIPVRIGPATDALLTTLIDQGGEWDDFSAVIEALG